MLLSAMRNGPCETYGDLAGTCEIQAHMPTSQNWQMSICYKECTGLPFGGSLLSVTCMAVACSSSEVLLWPK